MTLHSISGRSTGDPAPSAPPALARSCLLRFAGRACAAALLCATAGVSAQTVFRSVDATGSVRFPDRKAAPRPAPAAFVTTAHVSSALAGNVALSSLGAITIDAQEAARSLGQARLERARGARPLVAERAVAGRHDLVTLGYWRRQERLRQSTEQALRRSNETDLRMRAHRAPDPVARIAVKDQP